MVKVIWHKAASRRTWTVQSYSPGGTNMHPIYRKPKNGWPWQCPLWTPSKSWFLRPIRAHIPNGISNGSTVFAQMTAECPYTLQWDAPFPLKIAHCAVQSENFESTNDKKNIKRHCHEFSQTSNGNGWRGPSSAVAWRRTVMVMQW